MQTLSKVVQDRFVEFFRAHVDVVAAIAEHFTRDPLRAQQLAVAVFTEAWHRFQLVEPADRAAVLYDHLYRLLWELDLPPATVDELPYPPIEGEWSPLRPSDVFVASVLIRAAEALDPRVDWPLLHLMVRAGVSTEMWAKIVERPVADTARRISSYQLAAHRATQAAALVLAGPECAERPLASAGASVDHLLAHTSACVACNGFCEMLVPTPRLIAAAAYTDLGPGGRQKVLNAVFAAPAPAGRRSRRLRF